MSPIVAVPGDCHRSNESVNTDADDDVVADALTCEEIETRFEVISLEGEVRMRVLRHRRCVLPHYYVFKLITSTCDALFSGQVFKLLLQSSSILSVGGV